MPQFDANSPAGQFLTAVPIIRQLAPSFSTYPSPGTPMNVTDHPDNNLPDGTPGMGVMPSFSPRAAGVTQNQGGQG